MVEKRKFWKNTVVSIYKEKCVIADSQRIAIKFDRQYKLLSKLLANFTRTFLQKLNLFVPLIHSHVISLSYGHFQNNVQVFLYAREYKNLGSKFSSNERHNQPI